MTKPNDSTSEAIRVEQERATARSIHQQAVKLQQQQGISYAAAKAQPAEQQQSDYSYNLEAEFERVCQQRDDLLAALKEIERMAMPSEIAFIAQAAIAAAEGKS